MKGLFITGTDTAVGKTVVAAALMCRFRDAIRLRYWKPIETGVETDNDTETVRHLSGCSGDEILACGVRLPKPVSPHLAARWAGERIDLRALEALRPNSDCAWLVEGAGGLLVPLNDSETMVDWIRMLRLAVLVVARSGLGTINHTLLTLEALRSRSLPAAGVLMVGEPNQDNREAVEHYGCVPMVGELPLLRPLTPESLAESARRLDPGGRLVEFLQ